MDYLIRTEFERVLSEVTFSEANKTAHTATATLRSSSAHLIE